MQKAMSAKDVGAWGEEQALAYLKSQGMTLIARNFIAAVGEVDLIMEQAGVLVFVEVKTRRSDTFGIPEDSITPKKLERVYKASLEFLDQNSYADMDWQIDVVAIESDFGMKRLSIHHYADIEYQPT